MHASAVVSAFALRVAGLNPCIGISVWNLNVLTEETLNLQFPPNIQNLDVN